MIVNCPDCGKQLDIRPWRVRKDPDRRCMECYRKQLPGFTMNEGYRRLSNRKYEHRVIAEKKLGRPLASPEIVHHENEIRVDNRGENLKVCVSPGVHLRDEHGLRRDSSTGKFQRRKQ